MTQFNLVGLLTTGEVEILNKIGKLSLAYMIGLVAIIAIIAIIKFSIDKYRKAGAGKNTVEFKTLTVKAKDTKIIEFRPMEEGKLVAFSSTKVA